jgi:KDO2-lipid IV(A) lauroyltransferase
MGRQLGRLGYALARGRRRIALENLESAFKGEKSDREIREIARSSYRHLGMNLVEFFQLPSVDGPAVERLVTISGRENLDDALAKGKGALLLSVHLGNWDLMGTAIVHAGYQLTLITKVSRNEAVNRIWMGYRAEQGIGLLSGRGVMKESLRHLAKGGAVGFVLDQNALRSDGVFVPFFGRQACTLTSLAILARRKEALVVPVHTYRENRFHRVVIGKPLEHEPLPDGDDDIRERTAGYMRWTEEVIRSHPDQWTWLHDRWKTKPKEESKVQSAESRGQDSESKVPETQDSVT